MHGGVLVKRRVARGDGIGQGCQVRTGVSIENRTCSSIVDESMLCEGRGGEAKVRTKEGSAVWYGAELGAGCRVTEGAAKR